MTDATHNLIQLLAKSPMMRTVQIADRLDLSIDDTESLLRPLVANGSIIAEEVEAPNNRKATAYELSAQFKASPAFAAMTAAAPAAASAPLVALKATLTTPPVPAPAPVPSPKPAPVPTVKGFTVTKVERAINFIKDNGPATGQQLHAALGLSQGEYVSSYLGGAIRTHRLARDGDLWVLPPAEETPLAVPKFGPNKTTPIPHTMKTATPAPATAAAPAASAPAQIVIPPAAAGFRCALWPDGTFEMQRDGATIAALTPLECNHMVTALQARAAANPEAA